jgi:hypothetical protein
MQRRASGQRSEQMHLGAGRDRRVQREKVSVHDDCGQMVERILGQAAVGNVGPERGVLGSQPLENLSQRDPVLPTDSHRALSDPFSERTGEPERRLRHHDLESRTAVASDPRAAGRRVLRA